MLDGHLGFLISHEHTVNLNSSPVTDSHTVHQTNRLLVKARNRPSITPEPEGLQQSLVEMMMLFKVL